MGGRRLLQSSNQFLVTISGLATPADETTAKNALLATGYSVLGALKAAFPGTTLVSGIIFLPTPIVPSTVYSFVYGMHRMVDDFKKINLKKVER